MNDVQHRRDKQEGELDGLGDPRKEGRLVPLKATTPRRVFVLRFSRVIHRKAGPEQTKHHRDKAPGHKARRSFIKLARRGIGQLSEEDPAAYLQPVAR